MELLCTTCKRRRTVRRAQESGYRCPHCKTLTLVAARQYDADVARLLSWSKATEQR